MSVRFSAQLFILWLNSPSGKPDIILIWVHCCINKYLAEILLSLWGRLIASQCDPLLDHLQESLSMAWPHALWPASHSCPDLVLQTHQATAPKATKRLIQEPLPQAILCLCSLRAAVVTMVGHPRESRAWEPLWERSSVSRGTVRKEEGLPFTQSRKTKTSWRWQQSKGHNRGLQQYNPAEGWP